MVSDAPMLERYRVHAQALGRSFELDDRGDPLPTISTDMANVSLEIPSIHPMLGIESNGAVNHQHAFAAACVTGSADRAIFDGAIALAQTAIDVATDDELRANLGAGIGRQPGR
jgi:metal-dependent amidase/aminoacylase/carboxypeptidase family protein